MRALGAFLIAFGFFFADTATAGARGMLPDRIPDQGGIQASDASNRSSEDSVESKGDSSTPQQPNRTSAADSVDAQPDDSPDPGKGTPNSSRSEHENDSPY